MPRPLTYTVQLVPPSGDDQPHLRLRAALKALWRSYRLRCVAISELPPGDRPGQQPVTDSDRIAAWLREGAADGR